MNSHIRLMQNATTTMAIECGLIGFLVAKAIIATVQFFGLNLAASYTAITNALP